MISCSLGGRLFHIRLLTSTQLPCQMWLLSEQNFCTSKNFEVRMTPSGFSLAVDDLRLQRRDRPR